MSDYACGTDGVCLGCHTAPAEHERILCSTCCGLWHAPCLSRPPSLAAVLSWVCPDCTDLDPAANGPKKVAKANRGGIVAKVLEIMDDESLTDAEKVRRRQELLGGKAGGAEDEEVVEEDKGLRELDDSLKCNFCIAVLERPVSIPCGHNFCLKCFQSWVRVGNLSCPKCRIAVSRNICSQPRINSALVNVIRMARIARSASSSVSSKVYHFIQNQSRPDKAFTTERAKKTGKANACSGKIFVTVPPDHFGPILAENDPERGTGVLVGETWEDRMECRQWGAHLPHVAGIAGQSAYGAQSVALSGGYEDDEDHGDWFLYTGSGGRDLSGNKRTNKEHSFDQKFDKSNEALRVSCKKGYPVRVVRSHKEKRSSYAPDSGVRYDGVYRIEKCWRKPGAQGHKVCRYLFVRCDNAPAPWTSDVHGDRPRNLPAIKELKKNASDIFERTEPPSWDYDVEHGWKWKKPPPPSKKVALCSENSEDRKISRRVLKQAHLSIKEKLLQEFSCLLCKSVLNLPMTTPCAHNFCKSCLDDAFSGKSFVRERGRVGGRALRQQKNIMKCPCCPTDISEFLQNPRVNTDLKGAIETLQKQIKEEAGEASGDSMSSISDEPQEIEGPVEVNEDEPQEIEGPVEVNEGELDSAPAENEEAKEKASEEQLPKAAVAKGGGKRKKAEKGTSKGSKKAKKSVVNDGED